MLKLLKTHFGYDSFRPLQKEIIDTIISGQDSLVLMPTGGGKSLCFQLPALTLPGITLVISPLIALMKDQVDTLCANGISAAFLNSSLTLKEQASVMQRASSGELKILYLAPERLETYGFSDFLGSLNVSLLAIDEAHCISEWGHDFRPDYRNLRNLREKFSKVPVIALTATATPTVREDILHQLGMEKAKTFILSFNRENLHYSVRPKYNAFAQLVELLQSFKNKAVIVYCFSRKNTEEIAQNLADAGLPAVPYHAGLPKKTRIETQEKFIRDEVPIIVATIAFGMGIDKPDVRLVVHMDLPKTIESYYQETGRAGRDGLPSECVLFYSYADRRKQEYFINQIANPQEQRLALSKLDNVIDYCQDSTCRRAYLLNYFGEDWKKTMCDACDNCVELPTETFDATEISQKIISTILRTGERFGTAHICDVLHGSKKKRIVELKHHQLSVHGIAQETSLGALREYVEALKKSKYLEQNNGEYPTLRVSQKGRQALLSNELISLPISKATTTILTRKFGSDLEYDIEAFEKLRKLRKQIADEQNVPPFVIFGDRTLQEMAYYFPASLESFAHIFGVGRKKLEEFGEAFLACISLHALENDLNEKPIPGKTAQPIDKKISRSSLTLQETKAMLLKKLSIQKIADKRELSPSTIIQHIEKLTYTNQAPDISYLKPNKEQFEIIKNAFQATNSPSLTPAFKYLEEKYEYNELRLVRLFLQI